MVRLAALALVATLSSLAPTAQTLTVTGTQPSDFAAGVPLSTEVRVTFSEALSAPPALVLFPDSAATRGTPTLSSDARTAVYPLTLEANTRYVALVPLAEAASGARLVRPAALNFTTAASAGSLTVRGAVSDPAGASVDRTLVALATADLATGAVSLIALRVLDASGSSQAYALGPVPIGLYVVAAVRLPGALYGDDELPAFGVYDTNGDGLPDPVIVPINVNVELEPLPGTTAREGLADAQAAADGSLPGARLVGLPPTLVDEGGTAPVWSYLFDADGARVRVVSLGLLAIPVPEEPSAPGAPSLPDPFVDSDAVIAAADAGGGADFRATHAARTVAVTLGTDDAPAWRADYVAADAGGTVAGRFSAIVDLATGTVLSTTSGEDAPAGTARLALAGANPSAGDAVVTVTLDRARHARVTVVDALGRTVAVLADGPLPAGTTALRWAGVAAPGVYRATLDADGLRDALGLTVAR